MLDVKKTMLNILGLVAICAVVIGVVILGVQFWPFLIAIVFAIILERTINFIVKKSKASRKFVGTIMVVLVYLLIGVLVYVIASSLIKEAISFSTTIPTMLEELKLKYNNIYNDLLKLLNNLPSTVTSSLYDIGLKVISKGAEIVTNGINGIVNFVLFFPNIIIYVIITFLATLFLVTDRRTISRSIQEIFPTKLVKKISAVVVACFSSLGKYLKAQLIMICITFMELFIAFLILDMEYPLLLATLIAIIDALPILGTGTILLPWAVYSAITGNIGFGIALLVTYLVITVVRQLVEPRIVSSKLGVHPFVTLVVMYIGFKIFGLIGLIIGPVMMIIFKNVFAIMFEAGYLKKIFVYKKEVKNIK
ncbi:MAG: sporulation integral membrane protein YtvI [Clostridia bacterium]|nr:sporulation integral membrane protein YtvI [Clostridia bacterium]